MPGFICPSMPLFRFFEQIMTGQVLTGQIRFHMKNYTFTVHGGHTVH